MLGSPFSFSGGLVSWLLLAEHEELHEVEEVPGLETHLVLDTLLIHELELFPVDSPVQVLVDFLNNMPLPIS